MFFLVQEKMLLIIFLGKKMRFNNDLNMKQYFCQVGYLQLVEQFFWCRSQDDDVASGRTDELFLHSFIEEG